MTDDMFSSLTGSVYKSSLTQAFKFTFYYFKMYFCILHSKCIKGPDLIGQFDILRIREQTLVYLGYVNR